MRIAGCRCLECRDQQEPSMTAAILQKRTEGFVLPLLKAIRDADLNVSEALRELSLRGFQREAGKIISALESDAEIARFSG